MDWYRNTDWNSDIESKFFARLAKSKSQRDQYLSIQILELAQIHPNVTKGLSKFYFESRTDDFNDGRVLGALAEASLAMNNCDDALRYYLKELKFEDVHPNFIGVARFRFPLLVALMRRRSSYKDVLDLWEKFDHTALLPIYQFEHAASRALIHFDLGEKAIAWRHAEKALRAYEGMRPGDAVYFGGSRYECSDLIVRKKVENTLARQLGVFGYMAWRFGLRD